MLQCNITARHPCRLGGATDNAEGKMRFPGRRGMRCPAMHPRDYLPQ